jgi:hypothetical protein
MDSPMTSAGAASPSRPRASAYRTPHAGLLPALLAALFALAGCDSTDPPGPPAALAAAGGNAQQGAVGVALSDTLVLEVKDARGRAVPNIPVTWAVASGGGTVTAHAPATDAVGRARATWRLGTGAGDQTATATVDGVAPFTFTATAQPGPAAALLVAPADTTLTSVGDTVLLRVTLRDQHGNPIHDAGQLTWSALDPAIVGVTATGAAFSVAGGNGRVEASAGGRTGSAFIRVQQAPVAIQLTPATVQVPAGDTVTVTATVQDARGAAIANAGVTWISSAPAIVQALGNGRFLGVGRGQATVTAVAEHAPTVTGTALVSVLLGITNAGLADARQSLSYAQQLLGAGAGASWSVAGGTLPAGLTLAGNGLLAGTPSATGTSTFTVRVDEGGESAQRQFSLRVCDAPAALAVGEAFTLQFPYGCGVLLPGGTDQLYRVAITPRAYRTNSQGNTAATVTGGVMLRRRSATHSDTVSLSPPGPVVQATQHHHVADDGGLGPEIRRLMEGTERVHTLLREEEARRFGPSTTALSAVQPGVLLAAASFQPDTLRTFFVVNPDQSGRDTLRARFRGMSESLIYYEALSMPAADWISDARLQVLFDYYEQHGRWVIDDIFGGLAPGGTTNNFKGGPRLAADLDGNGRIIVLQIPESRMIRIGADMAAAYVSSCDRYPLQENYNAGGFYCTGSNEGEVFYTLSPQSDFFLGVLVHEAKHISSHGYAIFGGRGFQPSWIEEGTAEIANELAGRSAIGAVEGAELRFADFYAGTLPTPEGYAIAVIQARARTFLRAAPINSVIGNPNPNPNQSTYYGASWMFHRYLADAYAAAHGGEAAFFRRLNTQGTGLSEIQNVVGRPFTELLTEFATAIMVEGQPQARNALQKRFRSYDFQEIASRFAGTWPYLNSIGVYSTGDIQTTAIFGGLGLHDFVSPGTPLQRLDLFRNDAGLISVPDDVVLTVIRLR